MTKILTMLGLAVLMLGLALYVGKTVAPGATTKASSINNGINGASVNSTNGTVTYTAP